MEILSRCSSRRGITCFLFLLLLIGLIYSGSRFHREEEIVLSIPTDMSVLPTISDNGTFRFHQFASVEPFLAVSAFWHIDGKSVRVFLMKERSVKPKIYCSFRNSDSVPTNWNATTNCHGKVFALQEWNEFEGTLRGFSICCDDVEGKYYSVLRLSAILSETNNETYLVELPIEKSLPDLMKTQTFPYKFAICLPPMFGIENYTAKFLVEFIEVHRALGADLMIFYLFDRPTLEVKQVLDSYRDHYVQDELGKFRIIVIYWHLPSQIKPESTWSRTQISAYNDCLYRFGRYAEYIVFSDLDEVVMPNDKFGYSWSKMVEGREFAVACSCQVLFWFHPLNDLTKKSIYYAQKTTLPKDGCRPKCVVRSGRVHLYHVHQALEPLDYYNAADLFTLHHYRYWPWPYEPDARKVMINQRIWPLRAYLQVSIDDRMSRISPDV